MDDDAVADDARLVGAADLAVEDVGTGHGSDLGDVEDLTHLELGGDFLLEFGSEHTFHGLLDFFDGIVDDAVGADFHALLLGSLAGLGRRTHLEGDDDSVGGSGEGDIVLGNLTHGLVDDVDGNLLGGELDEGVAEGLDGAIDVALDDDVEFLESALLDATADFVERQVVLGADALLALQLLALGGNLAGFLVGVHDVEGVASLRSAVESEDGGSLSRTDLLDALAAFVEHRFDAAIVGACQQDVAHAQGAVGAEDGGDVATTLVQRGLDDGACGLAVGVGLEVQHLGFEQHLLHEFGHAHAFLGADVLALVLAAPVLDEEVHLSEVLLDLLGVGSGLVYLVDGEDDGDPGSHGVVDGFLGLRHDVVVGSDDDDGDVGDLCTTGTHGGESLVARGVEEGDVASVLETYVVGTDVLCDATSLAGDDVGLADVVEQRSLTVVHVTHDGDDGGAGNEVSLIVGFLVHGFADVGTDVLGLESELVGHQVDGLLVHALVDADHDAEAHAGADDLGDGHVHHAGQLVGGDELGELQDLGLLLLQFHLRLDTCADAVAFLAAVLGALAQGLVLAGGEACQGLADLLGDFLFALLDDDDGFLRLVLLAALAFALRGLGLLLVLLAALVLLGLLLAALVLLLGSFGLDVHAFALLLPLASFGSAIGISALLALLSARRACALVEGIEVDVSLDLEVQHGLCGGLHAIDAVHLFELYPTLLLFLLLAGSLIHGGDVILSLFLLGHILGTSLFRRFLHLWGSRLGFLGRCDFGHGFGLRLRLHLGLRFRVGLSGLGLRLGFGLRFGLGLSGLRLGLGFRFGFRLWSSLGFAVEVDVAYDLRLLHLGQRQCLAIFGEDDGLLLLLGLACGHGRNQGSGALSFLELSQGYGVLFVRQAGIGIGFHIVESFLIEEINEGLETDAAFLSDFIDSYWHNIELRILGFTDLQNYFLLKGLYYH